MFNSNSCFFHGPLPQNRFCRSNIFPDKIISKISRYQVAGNPVQNLKISSLNRLNTCPKNSENISKYQNNVQYFVPLTQHLLTPNNSPWQVSSTTQAVQLHPISTFHQQRALADLILLHLQIFFSLGSTVNLDITLFVHTLASVSS